MSLLCRPWKINFFEQAFLTFHSLFSKTFFRQLSWELPSDLQTKIHTGISLCPSCPNPRTRVLEGLALSYTIHSPNGLKVGNRPFVPLFHGLCRGLHPFIKAFSTTPLSPIWLKNKHMLYNFHFRQLHITNTIVGLSMIAQLKCYHQINSMTVSRLSHSVQTITVQQHLSAMALHLWQNQHSTKWMETVLYRFKHRSAHFGG